MFPRSKPTLLVGSQSEKLSSSSVPRNISILLCWMKTSPVTWQTFALDEDSLLLNPWQTNTSSTSCRPQPPSHKIKPSPSCELSEKLSDCIPGRDKPVGSARAQPACPPHCKFTVFCAVSSSLLPISLPVTNNILDISASRACSAAQRLFFIQKGSFLWFVLSLRQQMHLPVAPRVEIVSFRRDHWDEIH